MDVQTLFGTQFLALAFFNNFWRFDSQLAWSGVILLEAWFLALYALQKREDRARRLID